MTTVDPSTLTRAELVALGFRQWDETGLMLMPESFLPRLMRGTVLRSITGRILRSGVDEINKDTRHGFLAFGVFPRDSTVSR